MTPKEKAIELIDKFGNIEIMFESQIGNIKHDEQSKASKQCALIAVDEIIQSCPLEPAHPYDYVIAEREAMDFWQEVKQEIEKL